MTSMITQHQYWGNNMEIVKIGAVALLFLFISPSLLAKTSDIPVEAFFNNPDYTNLQLSPNGKYLAVISSVNKRRNIVLLETENLKNYRPLTGYEKLNVGGGPMTKVSFIPWTSVVEVRHLHCIRLKRKIV